MFFLVDKNVKIIFGWSAKCACSHIKKIFWFLQNNNMDNKIHTANDCFNLPDDINNYETIIFCRNPYERIVSGFLDKYNKNGQFRHYWNNDNITFSNFIDVLLEKNWDRIDKHHFIQQTCEMFDKNKIMISKSITLYDIKNINYNHIEEVYNKKIQDKLLSFKGGHERKIFNKEYNQENVYNLDINLYYYYDITIEKFYNEEIKNKVYNFYKKDFEFFKENGINYDIIINN